MKKQLLCGITLLVAGLAAFAGDAAAFVDVGLSADGKTYVFGEYGKTDLNFQSYAEIYTVDIEKNDFVSGGVFRTNASNATASKSGKAVYEELAAKASWFISKYNCKPASAENLLYVREDAGKNEFSFKDFEGSTTERSVFYHINLVKNVLGSGKDCRSSFFISLEKQDEAGTVLSRYTVGSPEIRRKGVTGYKIDRIFSDKSGRNLVFIIEKTVEDETGTSIRYMVETIRL